MHLSDSLKNPELSDPVYLEQSDTILAQLIHEVVHKGHPFIRAINFTGAATTLYLRNGSRRQIGVREPNSLCFCGSGKKFKKCCMNKPSNPPLICPFCTKQVLVVKDPTDNTTCRCYDPKPNHE